LAPITNQPHIQRCLTPVLAPQTPAPSLELPPHCGVKLQLFLIFQEHVKK
jgi:hypothetical protein